MEWVILGLAIAIVVAVTIKVFLLPRKADLKSMEHTLHQNQNTTVNDLKARLDSIIRAQNEQKDITQKNMQLLINKMGTVSSEVQESLNRLRDMLRNDSNTLRQDLKIMDGEQKLTLEKAINAVVTRLDEAQKVRFDRILVRLSELDNTAARLHKELKDGVGADLKTLKLGLEGCVGRLDDDLRSQLQSDMGEIRSNLQSHSGKMEKLYGEAINGFELIEARVDSRSNILVQAEIMVRDIYRRMESIEEAMTLSLARDIVSVVEQNAGN